MTQLARYSFGERLHEGRRHEIVRGTAPDGRPVVLKVLRQLHPSPDQVARFRHEYERIAGVRSEHVVGAVAFETDQRRWALVQEDFGASSLAGQLGDDLSLRQRLEIAVAAARGLADVHARNVIHKDINPSNIVRNPQTGEVKLIDFGIATALTSESPAFSNRNRLEGTLHYVSPEQTGRVGARVDYRSDLYSFGVTLYELFAGRRPFESDDPLELVHAHIARPPRPLTEASPELPPVLDALVMRLLNKRADDRYQTAFGLLGDLQRCLEGLSSSGAIEAFEIGADDVSDRLLVPARLYGREEETAQLIRALRATTDPSSSDDVVPAVLVTGAAGLGKSALVQELFGPLTKRRGYYVVGKFEQFRRTPFSAVVAAFSSLVPRHRAARRERGAAGSAAQRPGRRVGSQRSRDYGRDPPGRADHRTPTGRRGAARLGDAQPVRIRVSQFRGGVRAAAASGRLVPR